MPHGHTDLVSRCLALLLNGDGEQGWCSGESARRPLMWLGSIPGPGVICEFSLLLVLYFALRGFSLGTPVFPTPQKPTFPNSNSILEFKDISNEFLCSPGAPWVNKLHFLRQNSIHCKIERSHLFLSLKFVHI